MSVTISLPSVEKFRATCRKLNLKQDQERALGGVLWRVHTQLARRSELTMESEERKDILKKVATFKSSLDMLVVALGITATEIEASEFPLNGHSKIGERATSRLMAAVAGREKLKRDIASEMVSFVALGVAGLGDDLIRIKKDIDMVVDFTVRDKGGRPADIPRNQLIMALCKSSGSILGRAPTATAKGRFSVLVYEVVVKCCGLSDDGLEELIERSVSAYKKMTNEGYSQYWLLYYPGFGDVVAR